MAQCPVCGMMVNEKTTPHSEYKGKTYYFMNAIHKEMFGKDPAKFVKTGAGRRGMQGMSGMNH